MSAEPRTSDTSGVAAADAISANRRDRALLAALDPRQPLLDRNRIRHRGIAHYGALTEVATSASELVSKVLLSASVPLVEAARQLQEKFDARMVEFGLSAKPRYRWNHLCRDVN